MVLSKQVITDRFGRNMKQHCVKSVRIRSYSGPYFSVFGLNTDQYNSEYEHFLRSGRHVFVLLGFFVLVFMKRKFILVLLRKILIRTIYVINTISVINYC